MKKISIIGNFGYGENIMGGQVIKTTILYNQLIKVYKSTQIKKYNTANIKRNPIKLLWYISNSIFFFRNIIILPAQNGIKYIPKYLNLFNKIFHRKIHYIVIGGWLPEFVESDNKLRSTIMKIDCVYVETNKMKDNLNALNLKNVYVMENFKELKIITEENINNIVLKKTIPFTVCTFSRVMKEKGIEDAAQAVIDINTKFNKTVYQLDIYGNIEPNYKERFSTLLKTYPSYIQYKGLVNYSKSVEVLSDYFFLLFPTYYKGEGFPGTILDAHSSALPVIATDWRYNSEIITNNVDGIIYKKKVQLVDVLERVYNNPQIIYEMKKNCLKNAKKYAPDNVIKKLLDKLE